MEDCLELQRGQVGEDKKNKKYTQKRGEEGYVKYIQKSQSRQRG